MKRTVIIGTSGTGKSTLGLALAQRLQLAHIELDALHWEPNWTPAAPQDFEARVREAIAQETWACSGNYAAVRAVIWEHADTLVWLDYAFPVVWQRIVNRTVRRAVTREELWNGNRESWRMVLSRDSMLLWVLKTYGRRRREYAQLLARPEYSHLQTLRFKTPQQTQQWLQSL